MVRRPPLAQRLSTAARWPVGVAITAWRYLWRLTPVERWEWAGTLAEDGPPPLPPSVRREGLQTDEDGTGTFVHRQYRVRIRGSAMAPEELMGRVTADLDAVAPTEFASFHKVRGERPGVHPGDEFVVRMPGPWDGPVRVVETTPVSFRLATLAGHLEAGQIEFRTRTRDGALEFTIESWARSGDRLSDLLYSRLRVAKEVQLHMWTSVLEGVVRLSGGSRHGALSIVTRRVEDAAGDPAHTGPRDRRARRALAALARRPLNVDPAALDPARLGSEWHLDDLSTPLPGEPSGPPVPGGSWAVARRLMQDYQVADPALVRASYRTDVPLAGRDMLLQIRFLGLRFRVGVRVGEVYDEHRTVDGRRARVFGWDYLTLAGHFEEGRLHYEVWKWLDTGDVEFRLRACSRPARSGPLWMRFGFRLVGRRNQVDFYRRAGRRMAGFTRAQLELARSAADAAGQGDGRPRAGAGAGRPPDPAGAVDELLVGRDEHGEG